MVNMKLGELLKPSKGRIATSLALPYAWAGLLVLYSISQNFLLPAPSSIPIFVFYFIVSFLIDSLFYYPFVCSISVLYTSYKKKQFKKLTSDKKILMVMILSIIILNPIILKIISNLLYYSIFISSVNQSFCGILVKTVLPDSPASKAGIIPGSIIYKVNGTLIDNPEIIQNMYTNYKVGQVLEFWIYYGNGTYGNVDVTLGTPPSNLPVKGFLGINFTQRFVKYDTQCSR